MYQFKRFHILLGALAIALLPMLAACDDDDDDGDKVGAYDTKGYGSYDLIFTGTGFDPHNGQEMHMAVVDTRSNEAVEKDSTEVKNGTFSFTVSDVVQRGYSYRVAYFVDMNGDGKCDQNDHAWVDTVDAVSDQVTLSVTHDTDFDFSQCPVFNEND